MRRALPPLLGSLQNGLRKALFRPCPACHRATQAVFCPACLRISRALGPAHQLPGPPLPLTKLWYLADYHSTAGTSPVAALMGAKALGLPDPFDLVVPVPLHRRRLRVRGNGQAAWLAVARSLGLPCPLGELRRRHPTRPQTELGRAMRHQNLTGAFDCPG